MKLLKKLSLLIITLPLFSSEITPSTQKISAFAIPKDMISINSNFSYLDNDIDIFSSIDKNKNLNYGAVGKLNGFDLSIGYGLHKHISIFYNTKLFNFDYMDSTLNNFTNEIFARVNFYDVPNYIFDDFTIDVGVIRNSSNSQSIKSSKAIYNLIKKIDPSLNKLSTSSNNLLYDGTIISKQIDSISGKIIEPKIKLSDLSDNSFYLRAIWGNRFSAALFNIFTGFKYSDISTKISLLPKKSQNKSYNELLSKFRDLDEGRSEKSLFAGSSFLFESENFIYDFNYQYLRLFSVGKKFDNKHNSIFDIHISYKANRSLLLYIGGRAMLNGFNGVIPYLHNQYTDDYFDKKYGYVKIGFIYNFNIEQLNSQTLYSTNRYKNSSSLADFLFGN